MSDDIRPFAQRTFEIRHATLRHIANLSPNIVCAADIAESINAHLRTSQRALKVLANIAAGSKSIHKRVKSD